MNFCFFSIYVTFFTVFVMLVTHPYTRASTSNFPRLFNFLHVICTLKIVQKVEVIYCLSGSGKSCLLGSWSLHHQDKFPNDAVVYHFVGSSGDSTGKQFSIFCSH